MHRTLEITVSPDGTDRLTKCLEEIETVIGLSVFRGASVKPPGDVLVVQVLNKGADDVLRCAADAQQHSAVSIVTAELASVIDPSQAEAVENDVDEAMWEEVENALRYHGRVSVNYVGLMLLGGMIATVGLLSEPVPQAIAFVAAAIIAPGFEPVAGLPFCVALRQWKQLPNVLLSVLVGYGAIVAAGAATFALLRFFGATSVEELLNNSEVKQIVLTPLKSLVVSACGAIAGVIMLAAYRRTVIAGPLIAIALIHTTALCGAALAAGQINLAFAGLRRSAYDIALVLVAGLLVFAAKQLFVHKRKPIV